jgi:two-component sensor histidine kinase
MYDQSLVVCRKAIAYLNERSDYYNYYLIMAIAVRYAVRDLVYKDSASAALDFFTAIIRQHPPVLLWQREEMLWGFGQCYAALGNYGRAEKEYIQLAKLVDSFSKRPAGFESFLSPEIVYSDYLSISHLFALMHQYPKADLYLRKIPEYPSYPVGAAQRVEFELVRSEIDSGMGHYQSALQHFWLHKRLSDSLYAVDKHKQVQELQIKYETEKKDNDIGLQAGHIQLLTKQNQLQQIQSEQSALIRNVMFGSLGALLLLMGVIYSRYQMKRRNIRQLELQKEEILEKNHSLEKLLHENEWLLLSSQSAYLQDESAFNAVMKSRHRIQAMSLIHQKLYKSHDVSSIDMREYIGDLVEYLKDSFETVGKVGVELRIEAVFLDVVQAVPVGLILNEAITNALKHAFPCTGDDRISIRLEKQAADELLLYVDDNGKGIGPGIPVEGRQSFGMSLIRGLVDELDGQLEMETAAGTVFIIRFKQVHPSAKVVSPTADGG